MILLHEAESHFHEITEIAAEQCHIFRSADHLVLFHKNAFELGGVKQEVIPGTSKQISFDLGYLVVRSMFRRAPGEGKCTFASASVHLSNHDRKEARNRKTAPGPVQGNH